MSSSFSRRVLSSLAIESPRSSSSTAFSSPIGSAFTSPRTYNFGASPRRRIKEISHLFQLLIIAGTLVSFLFIITGGYLYVVPSIGYNDALQFNISVTDSKECDVIVGNWVVDDDHPLYNASECPFVENGFNCLGNGRGHEGYLKWRWKPRHCFVPRFQVRDVLERLRGKRIVFVGDSMRRTQWESL